MGWPELGLLAALPGTWPALLVLNSPEPGPQRTTRPGMCVSLLYKYSEDANPYPALESFD
jgi:hypothetical protein